MKPILLNQTKQILEFTEFRFQFPDTQFKPEYLIRLYPDNSNTFHWGDGIQINTHPIDNLEYGEELYPFHKAILQQLNLEIPDWME